MTKLGKQIGSHEPTESLKQSEMNTFLNAKSDVVSEQGSLYQHKPNEKVILCNNLELFSKESNQNVTRRSPFNNQDSHNQRHFDSLNTDLNKIDIDFTSTHDRQMKLLKVTMVPDESGDLLNSGGNLVNIQDL